MSSEGKTTENQAALSSQELDKLTLSKSDFIKGAIKCIVFSALAIFVFFVTLDIGGESQIVFGFIYNFFIDILGDLGFWLVALIITSNLILHLFSKFIDKGKKHPKLHAFYKEDNLVYTGLYVLGTVFSVLYALSVSFPSEAYPEMIVGASTGGSVFPPVVLGVLWIILVGAVFMPFLLNYGAIELVGALLEPIMRPLFKLPGKSALNAAASFVSSSSLGVLITGRLYNQKMYTEKETVAIATCFSAVSIGFAYLVIDTAKMSHMFITIYGISFLLAFIIAAIIIRIPPISKKKDIFVDGTVQTEEDRKSDARYDAKIFSRAWGRAVKRAYVARPLGSEIKSSLVDSMHVIPQVLSMLAAIGVSALILAEYTPIFDWIGLLFYPILALFQIPDAAAIAPSLPVGIAEMFLPVLLIADNVDNIAEEARFFICVVSMVQIIFFSETATVMLASKIPIKLHEIVICFIERTIIAIPFAALAMYLLF